MQRDDFAQQLQLDALEKTVGEFTAYMMARIEVLEKEVKALKDRAAMQDRKYEQI